MKVYKRRGMAWRVRALRGMWDTTVDEVKGGWVIRPMTAYELKQQEKQKLFNAIVATQMEMVGRELPGFLSSPDPLFRKIR